MEHATQWTLTAALQVPYRMIACGKQLKASWAERLEPIIILVPEDAMRRSLMPCKSLQCFALIFSILAKPCIRNWFEWFLLETDLNKLLLDDI